jgi:proline dehydrogenase
MSILGGLFSTEDKSSKTTNTTTTTYTDQSANAGGDNSMAIGANANVTINNLSESVANNAIGANADVAKTAIAGATQQTQFVANTILGLSETAARENQDTRNSADNALKSTTSLISALQAQTGSALERAQAPEATSVSAILKPILYVGAALIVVFIIFSSRKKS